MIRTIKINIPTIKEITDLRYPLKAWAISKYHKLDAWAFRTFGTAFWRLMYRVRGKCGSILMGHAPIFNNPKPDLWIKCPMGYICTVCHELVEVKEFTGSYKNYSNVGREEDMRQLTEMRKRANNDAERLSIDKAMYNIRHEEKHVKEMREKLIKAHRDGDLKESKEIHEYVGEKKKYRREVI